MFGMVLAIGILVDDAIVVVENVERIMATEGLSPKEATRKAMKQITGAIIGITLVLVAVFIPMAFMQGSVGVIYRQFSLSMATSILFSAFLALTLTPALCATLLKPIAKGGHHDEKRGFFGWFNRRFEQLTELLGQGWVRLCVEEGDWPIPADLCRPAGRIRLCFSTTARLLSAGRGSGLHHDGRSAATGSKASIARSRRPRDRTIPP